MFSESHSQTLFSARFRGGSLSVVSISMSFYGDNAYKDLVLNPTANKSWFLRRCGLRKTAVELVIFVQFCAVSSCF
jgi:hypothetical protein